MRLHLEADAAGRYTVVRLVVFDDEDGPVVFDRTLLSGPNLAGPRGHLPESAEAAFEDHALNDIALNPGCYYGRERRWMDLPAGEYEVTGYLAGDEHGSVALAAEPLLLRVA